MLSKYVHIFKKNDIVCYYHSLNNVPLYLNSNENVELTTFLENNIQTEHNKDIVQLFKENGFLIENLNEDVLLYNSKQNDAPTPAITTAYFILSEACNMACKYCFLGNSQIHNCEEKAMSIETATQCFDYFIYQTKKSGLSSDITRQVVFYGGEPLIGFDTLKHCVQLYNDYKNFKKIDFDIEFSIVTNGTLLNQDIATYFSENNISVSLSLDGPNEHSNENRIFKSGAPAFKSILSAINILNMSSVDFGLSLTLSEEALLVPVENLIDFLIEKNIMSVNLNPLLYADEMGGKEKYHERATQYIIDFWKLAREKGIYEDRIMRKLLAFAEQKFYYSDCAATSGSQLVFAPNGKIGICHGNLESKDTFDFSIGHKSDLNKENLLFEWTKNSPILRLECHDCEAIGVCGGGCPLNAKFDDAKKRKIDSGFCVHSKKILEFMIWDLYEKMVEE